jgi:hypothetical protein
MTACSHPEIRQPVETLRIFHSPPAAMTGRREEIPVNRQ